MRRHCSAFLLVLALPLLPGCGSEPDEREQRVSVSSPCRDYVAQPPQEREQTARRLSREVQLQESARTSWADRLDEVCGQNLDATILSLLADGALGDDAEDRTPTPPEEVAPVALTFHPVLGLGDPADVVPLLEDTTAAMTTVADESAQPLVIGPAALSGEDVERASAEVDEVVGGQRFVSVDFRGEGARKWSVLTGSAACIAPPEPQRRVAIVIDGVVVSSPQVDPSVECNVGIVGGSTQITGSFTEQEAEELVARINGGA